MRSAAEPPAPGAQPALTAEPRSSGLDAATAAARRVIEALLHAGESAHDLVEVAAQLDALAERVSAQAPSVDERINDMWSGDGITRHDPVTGPENAIAPPLTLYGMPDGSVQGQVALHLPYQGPPGLVHGGISALILDHSLGVANLWAGPTGYTGELSLRYHRPTPLFEPLTVTARQTSVDGRKIWSEGTISTSDGAVCVSARGLFVAPRTDG